MTSESNRHMSPATLGDFVAAGVLAAVPIPGDPPAILTIDPPNEVLRLEIMWDGEEPPAISDYVHLSTEVQFIRGGAWATLTVHGTTYFAEAYPLLCQVADLVQLESVTFPIAVQHGLSHYHELLAAVAHMPVNEEVGLYGELLVFSHLVSALGPAQALDAWRGTANEEHDFGLPDDDLEVKTTTTETRKHWISSLQQLEPTLERPLWLVSVQLTGAGAGEGLRLPDVVERIEAGLPEPLQDRFRAQLAAVRYRVTQPRSSFLLLRPRAAPATFRVAGDFPRLTRNRLESAGVALGGIDQVTYLVNLDGLQSADTGPTPLEGFSGSIHS